VTVEFFFKIKATMRRALVLAFAVFAADASCPSNNVEVNQFMTICATGSFCADTTVCTDPTSVGVKMINCMQPVGNFFPSSGCVTAIKSFDSHTTADDASAICSMNMSTFVKEACYPSVCPDYTNLDPLTPLANCLVTQPSTLQDEGGDINNYNAYQCLQQEQGTTGVPSECQAGGVVSQYQHCNLSTQVVINNILSLNETDTSVCGTSILIGSLKQYCLLSFGEALNEFCTPTFCQQQFVGTSLAMCAGIGIVVGVVGGVIVLAAATFLIVRRRRRFEERQLSPIGGSNPNMYSPGGSSRGGFVPAYHGSGSFMSPFQSPSFKTSGAHGSPPSPPVVPLSVRKTELLAFYKERDPERTQEQVDSMFERNDFDHLCRAIKAKYGVLPEGWPDDEGKGKAEDQHAGLAVLGVKVAKKGEGKKKANTAKKFAKYNQMARIGLDESAIRQAMERDGVDATNWVYVPDDS